jgi:predicted small secreted protein
MNQSQKRIMKALIVGAVMGLAYEYVITPYISKPITQKVDEVVSK